MPKLFFTLLSIAALTSLVFFLFQSFDFKLVTAAVILLLTASYVVKYRREEGVGLAYFGLAYVGFGLALLGIGLMQTHAGCMFLMGDCYQPTLPSYWFYFKVAVNLGLTTLNGLALKFVYLNIRRAVD